MGYTINIYGEAVMGTVTITLVPLPGADETSSSLPVFSARGRMHRKRAPAKRKGRPGNGAALLLQAWCSVQPITTVVSMLHGPLLEGVTVFT